MVDCPELTRAVAGSGPALVTIASGMVVMVGRELVMTARALGWSMSGAVLKRAPTIGAQPMARRPAAL